MSEGSISSYVRFPSNLFKVMFNEIFQIIQNINQSNQQQKKTQIN